MKRLQEDTGAKMSILGKGSMRDKGKEEELRKSGEAKYAHLSNDLHVLIEVFAPPGEAYSRMSHALEEIKKFLVPDYNDEIRQEQLRELSYLNGSDDTSRGRSVRGRGLRLASTATTRGRGGAALPPRQGCDHAQRDDRSTWVTSCGPDCKGGPRSEDQGNPRGSRIQTPPALGHTRVL
ncbi:hypothetical protein AAFF_G00174400 [Aldrovandia affinis]|uniref:K Homology domain-containing protein n=1 Tax=Aldrovandia affinis TaxID=143900 RepID=A0AAD7RLK7_9TELE|nr:hypothetical protein AAFF_G00174400 [Aldrovandia affinis]